MRLNARTFIVWLCSSAAALLGLIATSATARADVKAPSYIPSLDIIPTATFATGNDEIAIPGGNPFQNPSVKFHIILTQPILKHLNFQAEQNRTAGYDVTLGTAGVTSAGKQIVPGSINDVFEEIRLGYTQPQIGVTLGYNYRWRNCCPNAGALGNLTPTDWHGTYLQLALSTLPIKPLNGTVFTLIGHQTYQLQHNSPAYQALEASEGIRPNGNSARFPFWYGLNATVPINSGLSVYGLYGIGQFDYFNNSVSPYYYDLADFGLTKTVNKYLSFVASVDSLSQQHLEAGNPFAPPNAIHRTYFAAGLDVHI